MSSRNELGQSVGSLGRRLLVVSDMHIGRDCKEITGFTQERPNPVFDRAFMDLLDFYTSGKESEWKVVFAGDFIDFMEVVVVPEKKGPLALSLSFEVTDEEQEFGLGSEAERVLVKLERTLQYHLHFFERVAQFVEKGGEIVVMRGNHDVEFYWPKVQRVFRRRLADIAFRGRMLDVDQALEHRNAFQERVIFAPWIYLEPGRIYIEHGHQYDEYCSFDHWLHPVSPTNPRRIDTPVSAFAMRYFVNLLNDFKAHNVDIWGWREYFDWLRYKGVSGSFYAAQNGFSAFWRMLEYAIRWTFGRVRRYSKEHNRKLRAEALRFQISPDKLAQIDHLHHVPVSRNLPELMRLLFLDRLLLGGASLLLVFMILLFVEPVWAEVLGVFLVATLAVRINRRLMPRRFLLPGPKQASAARRICEVLEVPVVVMGHSHVRRHTDLGQGRRYINTGCWLPPAGSHVHADAQTPCNCKLSHLVVESGAPELRVFCSALKNVRTTDLEEAQEVVEARERESIEGPTRGLLP